MLIGIDGNEANVGTKVGISEFAFQLLEQFAKQQHANTTFRIYLKSEKREDLPAEKTDWQYRVLTPRKLWTQWRLPLDLFVHRPRPDVFFTPSHYSPRISPVPTVMSVMDVSYLHFPELFNPSDLYQLKSWTKYSVEQAKAVITISDSAKRDIIKAYSVQSERVHVVYPGVKELITNNSKLITMRDLQEKYGISSNYLLFVGTLQPRKNIERLIEAFSYVVANKKHHALQLVVVGKKGWLYEPILQAPEKFGVKDRVTFLDYVPDSDLPALYKHAQCYVLPSLYEGFGLPVLEAMKYDCPVITSKVSSLPEAGGDAALYVDPTDAKNIAETIEELLGDDKLREDLIAKGRKQIKKFSWEKAAKETLEVLQSVAR